MGLALCLIIMAYGSSTINGREVTSMSYTEQQIVSEIKTHIQKSGLNFRDWYVGIAQDPQTRLFSDHNVSRASGWWIYRTAPTSTEARNIEAHFVNVLGTDGGTGGGDFLSRAVYAYAKATATRE